MSAHGHLFYSRLLGLAVAGIPNELRATLWLELGKADKLVFVLDYVAFSEILVEPKEMAYTASRG